MNFSEQIHEFSTWSLSNNCTLLIAFAELYCMIVFLLNIQSTEGNTPVDDAH